MTIIPSQPKPRTSVANWKLDAAALRIYDRHVTLIYGGYDSVGARVDEHRFDIADDTTPTLAAFIAACPAGPTFKQQIETFGATLHPDLVGTIS